MSVAKKNQKNKKTKNNQKQNHQKILRKTLSKMRSSLINNIDTLLVELSG